VQGRKVHIAGRLGAQVLWNFCRAIGREDLAERQLDREVIEEVRREVSKYGREELLSRLWSEDVPAAPVNSIKELEKDPHLRQRGLRLREFLNPIIVNGQRLGLDRSKAPRRGEHTKQLLRELGYSEEEIEELRRRGVLYF